MWKLIKLLSERFNNLLLYVGIAIGGLAGLLGGLGIGVVLGVLIAPRSGEETREDLKRKAVDTIDSIKDFAGFSPAETATGNGDMTAE